MEALYMQTNSVIQETQQCFQRLNDVRYDSGEIEQDIEKKITIVNGNCDRLDVLLFKVPVAQRQNAKMRVDQLKYDIRHLQAALKLYQDKKQRRAAELAERESLLNKRFTANAETSIDIDYSLQHHNSMQNAHRGVDEMLWTGSNVLDGLKSQRETLKGARRRIMDVGSTLGLSNQTMKMIERRLVEDNEYTKTDSKKQTRVKSPSTGFLCQEFQQKPSRAVFVQQSVVSVPVVRPECVLLRLFGAGLSDTPYLPVRVCNSAAKLDNLIVNRYLSVADEDFVYCVDLDIRRFIERANSKAVLIFPPFNNYRRFLIHKVCASKAFSQYDIVTFSIGVGNERRTVVCFRHQLLQDVKSATAGKSFEEPTSDSVAGHTIQYTSWRSSTTPAATTTNTVTDSVCNNSSNTSTTNSSGSVGNNDGSTLATTTCSIARKRVERRDLLHQDKMGTETIQQLAGAGGVGHQQQHLHQQRQHNQVNAQPQPFLADGGTAFGGDSVKVPGEVATHPHLNVFGLNHPHIHQPAGAGTKLPAVVGIYRPPAARRALKLAEKALHQLAPPAACENPSDYNHRDPLGSTEHVRRHTEVTTIDKASSTPDNTESGGQKTSPTSEDDGSKCPTQVSSPVTDGALGSVSASVECSSVNSSVVSPTSARTNRPHRERRPDRAVYIPRARRSLTTPPVTTSSLPATTTATTSPNETVSKAADGLPTISNAATPLPKGTPRVVAASRTQQLPADATGPLGASTCSVVVPPEGTGRLKVKQQPHNSTAGPALEHSLAKVQLHNNTPILLNCDSAAEESSKRRAAHLGDHRAPVEAFKKRSYSLEEHNSSVHTVTASSLDERLQIVTEVSCSNELKTRQQQSLSEEFTKADCDIEQPTSTTWEPEDPAKVHTRPNETTMHRNNNRNRNAKNVLNGAGMIINDRPTEGDKIDHDEKELRRASQEMNRSNRRIMKQTFNSDVLEIDEPSAPPPSAQVGLGKIVVDKKQVGVVLQNGGGDPTLGVGGGKPPGIIATSNGSDGSPTAKASDGEEAGDDGDEEEEDWESMYDDNGDCLNPKMLEELTTAVGKVSIEVPQTDYKSYQTKQAVLNDEEFPHVLEVSNFPAEFKTQDLMMLFSQYKESGFDIKWVDDTHALAVFSSSKIAAEVLATGHSFARVKPLAEATSESRSKARKCASSLQPYRARPETCAALARRLVTTALGVRLKTAPEERENERRVLREAKERKLLAAKQRDEVWDS